MHAVRRIVVSYIRYASQRQACITFLTSYSLTCSVPGGTAKLRLTVLVWTPRYTGRHGQAALGRATRRGRGPRLNTYAACRWPVRQTPTPSASSEDYACRCHPVAQPETVSSGWHRQGRRPWRWSCAQEGRHREAAFDDATQVCSPGMAVVCSVPVRAYKITRYGVTTNKPALAAATRNPAFQGGTEYDGTGGGGPGRWFGPRRHAGAL